MRACREKGHAPFTQRRYERKTTSLICSWCGGEYIGEKVSPSRAGWATYCSAVCEREGKAYSKRLVHTSALPWRDCENCGSMFYERGSSTRCCPECRRRRDLRVWYMGWCIRDGVAFVTDQPEQRACSQLCAKRHHKSMRRVRERNAHSEIVHTLAVYERDNWTCRLCSKPVDRDAEVPEHLAPTLDHILPLALGGDHTYANIQCAHYICNSRKSHNVQGQLYFAA